MAVAEWLALGRLNDLLDRLRAHVPFYARRIGDRRVRSLEEFAELPLTTREDFRANYPFGLFAVPMEQVVRVHMSSGHTGKPVVVAGILPRFDDRASRVVDRRKLT